MFLVKNNKCLNQIRYARKKDWENRKRRSERERKWEIETERKERNMTYRERERARERKSERENCYTFGIHDTWKKGTNWYLYKKTWRELVYKNYYLSIITQKWVTYRGNGVSKTSVPELVRNQHFCMLNHQAIGWIS